MGRNERGGCVCVFPPSQPAPPQWIQLITSPVLSSQGELAPLPAFPLPFPKFNSPTPPLVNDARFDFCGRSLAAGAVVLTLEV